MSVERQFHTATLLPNGKVLLAGGLTNAGSVATATADLYDPATNTFHATGPMASTRMHHTATSLGNGVILIVGGTMQPTSPVGEPAGEAGGPPGGRFAVRRSRRQRRRRNQARGRRRRGRHARRPELERQDRRRRQQSLFGGIQPTGEGTHRGHHLGGVPGSATQAF